MGKNNTIIVRRSPIVIVKDFIGIEIIAGAMYILAGSLGHYAKIYRTLPFAEFLSFQLAQALLLFIVEIILILYVFFRWQREYFEIKDRQLIHRQGFLYRHENIIPLSNVSSISHTQGPLGKLAKYGTVRLADQAGKIIAQFRHIPDPRDFVGTLLEIQSDSSVSAAPSSVHDNDPILQNLDPKAVLSSQEHEGLEFKSTFRWDMKTNRVNKELEKSVLKTIAAFLNSKGGHLVIGVDDSKNILGMDYDYKTLRRTDSDGFENHFSHVFHSMIGAEFRQFVKLAMHNIEGKDLCAITVSPASHPAYLKTDEKEEFYIRTGNGTTSLKFSQAAAYIDSRFSRKV